MSALRWQDMDMRDKRTSISPEIAVDPSFADYRAHADPALDEALTGRFVSLEDALGEALPQGYGATLAAYRAWTGDTRHRYVTNAEARVNALGYKLLNDKRGDDAIVAFRVNADTHPKSANAFDSLGEAYDLTGRKADAIAAYEQSVKLNPASASGLAALARLRK
jgi:tetratricopeptide (TPR) repeat protein